MRRLVSFEIYTLCSTNFRDKNRSEGNSKKKCNRLKEKEVLDAIDQVEESKYKPTECTRYVIWNSKRDVTETSRAQKYEEKLVRCSLCPRSIHEVVRGWYIYLFYIPQDARSKYPTQLAKMSFDEILGVTDGVF